MALSPSPTTATRVSLRFEVETQTFSQVSFVFDNQNMAHAGFSRNAKDWLAAIPELPWSHALRPRFSANTRPPCFVAMARTMNKTEASSLHVASERLETR